MAALAALAGFVTALPALAQTEACEPWPGEPAPLPTLNDPDKLRSSWANLRAQELAQVARRFEATDPMRARQLWRRLLCMDPANDAAVAGLMRTPPVRVHRPPLRWAPLDVDAGADAWQALEDPLGVEIVRGRAAPARTPAPAPTPAPRPEPRIAAKPDPPRAAPPPPRTAPAPPRAAPAPSPSPAAVVAPASGSLSAAVDAVRADVRAARFQAAIDRASGVRTQLQAASTPAARRLLADTEVLVATAEIALGRQGAAVSTLKRALAANPRLTLDPIQTPRKVVRALEQARGEGG